VTLKTLPGYSKDQLRAFGLTEQQIATLQAKLPGGLSAKGHVVPSAASSTTSSPAMKRAQSSPEVSQGQAASGAAATGNSAGGGAGSSATLKRATAESKVVPDATLPAGWEKRLTASGKTFYVDHNSHKTQWDRPTAASDSVGASSSSSSSSAAAPAAAPARVAVAPEPDALPQG